MLERQYGPALQLKQCRSATLTTGLETSTRKLGIRGPADNDPLEEDVGISLQKKQS
jgi:hypothetical protein